jgi:hypothetical protein
MEVTRRKMRLEVKTTYFNNKVPNQLIVLSLFEDGEYYESESILSQIVDSKLIYVNKNIPIDGNNGWYYSIKKINSVNTFIEFAGTAIRETKTILKSVYQVLMSVETREGELQNDSL